MDHPIGTSHRSRGALAILTSTSTAAMIAGVAGVSCLLVDPPPALPTFPPAAPQIESTSVVPPPGVVTASDWPEGGELSFVVPVAVNDPTTTFTWYVFQDYGWADSATLEGPTQSTADLDGGAIQIIHFSVNPPVGPGCQTITFFADADPRQLVSETPSRLACSLCTPVSWLYDPSGAGDCPAYDAGGIPEADILPDGNADAADAQ
jgi:hypothetical protein